jgi:tumor protein p53-inducible protein 3
LTSAGASGVGTALIQLLKNVLEVKNVFATVGSEEKKNFLENNLQVTRAFNYKTDSNLVGQLMEITGNSGVDVVFDCVGGTYWQTNLDSLNMDGELILYGLLSGGTVNGDILTKILRKRIHLKASTLRNRSLEVSVVHYETKTFNKLSQTLCLLV